jgi:hypothetical protein
LVLTVLNLRVLLPETLTVCGNTAICSDEFSQWHGWMLGVLAYIPPARVDPNRSVGVWVVLR